MGTYDVAQICRNGHVITSRAGSSPELRQKFCDHCGETTISGCENCRTSIRGDYSVPGVAMIGFSYPRPAYCYHCGSPFPWTTAHLEAAKELTESFDELTEEEREQLQESLSDLTRDTPRTKVAESRFKRLMKKAGTDAYEGMRSVLVEIVSETIKKSIFPE